MNRLLLILVLLLAFNACKQKSSFPPSEYSSTKVLEGQKAMVVSAHPLASEAGKQILQKGGNAVDASIAVQLALAVVYPGAGNIGGGGFMIYRPSNSSSVYALDYREKAPNGATRNMYLDAEGEVTNKSRIGHLAAGVPGTVAGLFESHVRFGKLEFRELIQPAIDLAAKGFPITTKEAESLNSKREDFESVNFSAHAFVKDSAWQAGDLLIQPELAEALIRIKENGKAGFYEGKTANLIEAEMLRGKGLISLEDLKNYEAKWREPVEIDFKDYKLYSMPPPSSGGMVMAQMLEMVEAYGIDNYDFHSLEAVHLMIEAEKRAYADRAAHMGDSDYYSVPVSALKDSVYALLRMDDFNPFLAVPSTEIFAGEPVPAESKETTHLSIVDQSGNAVSVTTTLNSSYGSKVVVSGAGFLLNNEMDDFSSKPGVPNLYGLVGGEANSIQGGKRMLSSMTPTIVEKQGKLVMVLGTPGGSTIITSVFQVFLNATVFGLTLEESVQNSRFHHQWLPDVVMVEEEAFAGALGDSLKARGHKIQEVSSIGRVEAIQVNPDGSLLGVADRRGDDSAAGF